MSSRRAPSARVEKVESSSPSETSQLEADGARGRRPPEGEGKSETVNESAAVKVEEELQSRKRKRGRKDETKKYHCDFDGCGKSYSRAEHLYRHHLNHTPKQIFRCDYPGCFRQFVRGDLCTRHRERHTARAANPSVNMVPVSTQFEHATQLRPIEEVSQRPYIDPMLNTSFPQAMETHVVHGQSPLSAISSHPGSMIQGPIHEDSFTSAPNYQPLPYQHGPYAMTNLRQSGMNGPSTHGSPAIDTKSAYASSDGANVSRHSTYNHSMPLNGASHTNQMYHSANETQSPYHAVAPLRQRSTYHQSSPVVDGNHLATYPQVAPHTTLPTPSYPAALNLGNYGSVNQGYDEMTDHSEHTLFVPMNTLGDPTAVRFDLEDPTSYPQASVEEISAWLEDEQRLSEGLGRRGSMSIGAGFMANTGISPPSQPIQHPMAVASIIDPALSQTTLSEEKRLKLLALITKRFQETEDGQMRTQQERLFNGDLNHEGHVLSLPMMQTYIGSYWYHFHNQLPILHQPTFTADDAEDLLLIAVMAIGAANLDEGHGHQLTQDSSELANFLAFFLRGEIFNHKDFQPPAKLWVFQALLLLEIFEKLFSTRILHERANIFHAVMLTLMRRGSSLMGKSPLDSPPDVRGDTYTIAHSTDPWWNHWITTEATKRVALAALIIDSSHSALFGHSVIMAAHELRLFLPCESSLWSCLSGVEVGRIENEQRASGIAPIHFLEALKRTIKGEAVKTSFFGRTAIMAGLLNVTFHLSQRDRQLRPLGVLTGTEVWRSTLIKAFDSWGKSWDLESDFKDQPRNQLPLGKLDEANIIQSRIVLYNLAHMSMNVDVVQCQIYAKAKRLLGRTITAQDYNSSVRRIKEKWAPRTAARHAVYFALQFTRKCIGDAPGEYSARDDAALNRPWVLYFAALVIWTYGYALDGPIASPPLLATRAEQVLDLKAFLARVGGVEGPEALDSIRDRNACLGLLMILSDTFSKCRWELMHEASSLLDNCIAMLRGNA